MFYMLQAGIRYLSARFRRQDGAVATEYGLLLFLVAIAIIAAVTALGLAVFGVFDESATDLQGVTG
ncbi:MAG TPA: Flp family type IVb pilin [Actinomycetota bacterium]|nr:Flp family type IVb pilin [Actinomycetota bacterium]